MSRYVKCELSLTLIERVDIEQNISLTCMVALSPIYTIHHPSLIAPSLSNLTRI
jgi:hypothetical protein